MSHLSLSPASSPLRPDSPLHKYRVGRGRDIWAGVVPENITIRGQKPTARNIPRGTEALLQRLLLPNKHENKKYKKYPLVRRAAATCARECLHVLNLAKNSSG